MNKIDVYHVCYFPEMDLIRIIKLEKKLRMKTLLNKVVLFMDKEEKAMCYGVQILGRTSEEAEDLANLLIALHINESEENVEDTDYLPQKRRDC